MRVTLFGTRGSSPTPGSQTARYGGNTSSVEVRGENGAVVVLDAGTGIRQLGQQLPQDIVRVDILLTHLHMDHIQGLGFFHPLFVPDIDVHVWGPGSRTSSLRERLSRYLSPPLFPVHLRDLTGVTFHEIQHQTFDIGSLQITASLVCHSGPTLGYRIHSAGGTVTYLPDHEPALCRRDGRWPEPIWISGYDLAASTDLLIHDAQYTDEEYEERIGWGHSTYRHAFEFAALASAKKLIAFHHDPSHDDATLDRLLDDAIRRVKPTVPVFGGYEGAIFEVKMEA